MLNFPPTHTQNKRKKKRKKKTGLNTILLGGPFDLAIRVGSSVYLVMKSAHVLDLSFYWIFCRFVKWTQVSSGTVMP
jgi:hypothetical protein